MRRANVNDPYQNGPLSGGRLHYHDKERMERNNAARREEELTKQRLEARQPWRDKRFSQGHITNVARYRQCMKLPRWKRRRFRLEYGLRRRTPQTVLNSLKRFCIQ